MWLNLRPPPLHPFFTSPLPPNFTIMRLFLAIIVTCFPLLVMAQPQHPDFKKKGAPLPPFVLEKVNGTTFDNSVLKAGQPVMVMIVSPECGHCEYMVDSIKQLLPLFKRTQIILATELRNKPNLKEFLNKVKLTAAPRFKYAGYDKGNLIYFMYNSAMLPQVSFYDGKHKLVHSFGGNFPMDSLRSYIK